MLAKIVDIRANEGVCEVKFDGFIGTIYMAALEPIDAQIGLEIEIGFRASDWLILSSPAISSRNNFEAEILTIDLGEILASVHLKSGSEIIEALIPKECAKALKIGQNAILSISETSIYIK